MAKVEYIDFDYVKRHADFLAVLEHYSLKPLGRGVQRKVRCPFHKDTQPSLSVNLGRRVFQCFGCGAKGNVIEFVADMEDVGRDPEAGLRTAAAQVAAICGIELAPPDVPLRAHRKPAERRSGSKTTKGSASPTPLPPAPPAGSDEPSENEPLPPDFIERFEARLVREHPYFAERGLTPELVAKFRLGYYPDQGRGMMRNRLVIPIFTWDGNLVAYAGRWVGPDETIPEDEGKYKLPKGFRKELELYNVHRVRGSAHVIVVEGYFGVFRLHTLGVPAVALMGRYLSTWQLELLERIGVARLTFLLDGDEGGREAVPAIMAALAQSPILAKFAVLPEGTQPDTAPEPLLRDVFGRS